MVRVIWSPRAVADLRDISKYLDVNSPDYRESFVSKLLSLILELPDQPYFGATVPEFELETLRERQYHKYRVIYRLVEDAVEIVTIIHGARLLPDSL